MFSFRAGSPPVMWWLSPCVLTDPRSGQMEKSLSQVNSWPLSGPLGQRARSQGLREKMLKGVPGHLVAMETNSEPMKEQEGRAE